MNIRGNLIALVGALVIIGISVFGANHLETECEAKGGKYLRGYFTWGYDCYKVKGILK